MMKSLHLEYSVQNISFSTYTINILHLTKYQRKFGALFSRSRMKHCRAGILTARRYSISGSTKVPKNDHFLKVPPTATPEHIYDYTDIARSDVINLLVLADDDYDNHFREETERKLPFMVTHFFSTGERSLVSTIDKILCSRVRFQLLLEQGENGTDKLEGVAE
jgi:hypothetical protein